MRIAITGHRPNKLGNDYDLTSPLLKKIKANIETILELQGPTELISGMALGMDTLFAKLAIEKGIPLKAAIPCARQDSKWAESSRKLYADILGDPLTQAHYVSEFGYTDKCMQARNVWMVDNCDLLIAVWDGTSGGTANCVKYAYEIGRSIIYINPNDL